MVTGRAHKKTPPMIIAKPALAACALLAALLSVPAPADAHGRHHHHHRHWHGGVTLHFGAPWHWHPRWYYAPPPVIYYPAPVYRASPPVYVERDDTPPAEAGDTPPAYWYWCADAGKYYPYVKDCPGGWRKVPAQPAR